MDSNSFAEEQASNDFEISDPSTRGGFRTLSAREVPLELRFQTDTEAPQDVGSLEAVQVKILVGEGAPTVRVELTSESDLFFHYTSTIDERTFRTVRASFITVTSPPLLAATVAVVAHTLRTDTASAP